MKILQAAKKIPGGLTVVPLFLRIIVNTSFGSVLWNVFDGTFTTYLWKLGAMPILVVFTFCNATTINSRKAGITVYKGMLITAVKVGVGIITGLVCGTLFGEKGFLGLSTPAIVGTPVNSNGGLYAALTGEYEDTTDVGAVSILPINDGPLFTMAALGAAGVAKIPVSILIDCIIPVIVGCILGNLDEDIRKFCEPGATMLIPFSASPPGTGLNTMNLLKAEGPGVLLSVTCTLITGLVGYLIYKPLRMDHPEVGGAIGTTAGNAAAMPVSVAVVDTTLPAVAEVATAQIIVTIIVIAILCPVLVPYLYKIEARKCER